MKYTQINKDITINRKNLKNSIINFHNNAGTLNSTIKSETELIEKEKLKIVVAIHQPNLFAFSGVFKKIVM